MLTKDFEIYNTDDDKTSWSYDEADRFIKEKLSGWLKWEFGEVANQDGTITFDDHLKKVKESNPQITQEMEQPIFDKFDTEMPRGEWSYSELSNYLVSKQIAHMDMNGDGKITLTELLDSAKQ